MNDFNRRRCDMDRRQDQFMLDFNETKRRIAESQRRAALLLCAWAGVFMGGLVFLCWCVYHVLKTKGLVP